MAGQELGDWFRGGQEAREMRAGYGGEAVARSSVPQPLSIQQLVVRRSDDEGGDIDLAQGRQGVPRRYCQRHSRRIGPHQLIPTVLIPDSAGIPKGRRF